MSISAEDFALIVTGKASAELRERFLREAKQPDSTIRQVLRGAQEFARTKLNTKCPSASDSGGKSAEGSESPYRVLRQAAFWQTPGHKQDVVEPERKNKKTRRRTR